MASQRRGILIIFTSFLLAAITQGVSGQYGRERDRNDLNPFLPGVSSLWCFQCNSLLDKDCAYIKPNDTSSYHYKPCLDTEKYQGEEPFCRKLVQRIKVRDNMEVVIRRCGWVRHPRLDCYQMRNEDHDEISCQCFEMGCNGAPSLQLASTSLVLTLTGALCLGVVGW
ncbi:uncharacterized protein LOC128990729 [Macrosteles quadrilineatus]|uniref:uncharacterized protein LOC128990729 n=1 Tax=Macrosteles quadrilineatus TaxID=74068 RepID=UPI0023E23E4E|nr:uncharacterized protein LOC128990729 [Macrosteles quadrilineatus]XP_054269245.1 uncharacterized protein LOC128990729 [Macrosteles quadrilineatus]